MSGLGFGLGVGEGCQGAESTLEKVDGPSCRGSPAIMTAVCGPASEMGSSASASISCAASSTMMCVKWPLGTPALTSCAAERVVLTTTTMRSSALASGRA